MNKLLKIWVVGVLFISLSSLFKFINLAMYGEVNYLNNVFILITELLVLLFVLFVSIYLAWGVVIGKKNIDLSEAGVENEE